MKDVLAGLGLYWVLGLMTILLIGMATTFYYLVLPTWRDMETTGIRHSREYVTTKQAVLAGLVSDHAKLAGEVAYLERDPANAAVVTAKRAQQRALMEKIRTEAGLLPPGEVPSEVMRVIEGRR